MALLRIAEAARAAGVGRATLYRALAAGEVSITDTPQGKRIDTSELLRWRGALETSGTSGETSRALSRGRPETPGPDAADAGDVLRERLRALEAENARLVADLERERQEHREREREAREREAKLMAQVTRALLLLPAPATAENRTGTATAPSANNGEAVAAHAQNSGTSTPTLAQNRRASGGRNATPKKRRRKTPAARARRLTADPTPRTRTAPSSGGLLAELVAALRGDR